MPAPAKYLFDHDFAAPGGGNPSIAIADHEAKLREAEANGYARGMAAAKADADERSALAIERIAGMLELLKREFSAVETRLETEAIEVAVAVAKKLAPELIAREPFAEVAALVTGCFRHLVAAPHVVVRVNDAQHAVLSKRLDEVMRARGLESKLVVLAEPDIQPGDCRIEWADGGIIRDTGAIIAAIEEAVSRYVEARRAAPAQQENPRRFER
jgi:flagellar assembly protein FliH